jgi:hypothetical protein
LVWAQHRHRGDDFQLAALIRTALDEHQPSPPKNAAMFAMWGVRAYERVAERVVFWA